MQRVVIDEPYDSCRRSIRSGGRSILRLLSAPIPAHGYGIHSVECRHVERLRASLAAGHSIMLAPNHCRMADPLVLGMLGMEADCHLFAMASWHVFKQSRFQTFMTRRMGAFSVLREGNDRQAIDTAIDILVARKRPLIMFPEGAITRHNDLIEEMMDGPVVHRAAGGQAAEESRASRAASSSIPSRFVMRFEGDVDSNVEPDARGIGAALLLAAAAPPVARRADRQDRAGVAVASRKSNTFGAPRSGNLYERAEKLVERHFAQAGSRLEHQRYARAASSPA